MSDAGWVKLVVKNNPISAESMIVHRWRTDDPTAPRNVACPDCGALPHELCEAVPPFGGAKCLTDGIHLKRITESKRAKSEEALR